MYLIEEPVGASFTENERRMGTPGDKMLPSPLQTRRGGKVLQANPSMGKHMPKTIGRLFRKKICRVTKLQSTSSGDGLVIEGIPISICNLGQWLISHYSLFPFLKCLVEIPLVYSPLHYLIIYNEGKNERKHNDDKWHIDNNSIRNGEGIADKRCNHHEDNEKS